MTVRFPLSKKFPTVDYYADLPPASVNSGIIYVVLNSSGIWPFTYHSSGFYRSNGVTWVKIDDIDEIENGVTLTDITGPLVGVGGVVTTGTVGGQVDSIIAGTGISVDNTDPVNPIVTNTSLAGVGGYSAPLYFTTIPSDVAGYFKISYNNQPTEVELSGIVTNEEKLLRTYLYDDPINTTVIDAGVWASTFRAKVSNAAKVTKLKLEAFLYHADTTETTLFSAYTDEIENTVYANLEKNTPQPVFACVATDRLGVRIYAYTDSPSARTISTIVGDGNASWFIVPLALRHSLLRGLDYASSGHTGFASTVDLASYVPYTGATSDVTLGSNALTLADEIRLLGNYAIKWNDATDVSTYAYLHFDGNLNIKTFGASLLQLRPSTDAEVILSDAGGSSKLSIQDNAETEVAYINSDGGSSFSSLTIDSNTFTSVITGTGDNDTKPTQGYVDDAVSSIDLSGYVPYTGATGDVNLGANDFIVDTNDSKHISIFISRISTLLSGSCDVREFLIRFICHRSSNSTIEREDFVIVVVCLTGIIDIIGEGFTDTVL